MPTNQILTDIFRLKIEVNYLFENVVIPNWCSENLHGFPDTLYGFMMRVMSRIDLLSQYWDLTPDNQKKKGHQTKIMIDFLTAYFDDRKEQNSILVHIWRHQLMHTAEPRVVIDETTGIKYRWLLHWGAPHLPREHHYQIAADSSDVRILQLGLIYLTDQLEAAASAFILDLDTNMDLRKNFLKVQNQLRNVTKEIV